MVTRAILIRAGRTTALTIGMAALASSQAALQVNGTSPLITEASIRGHMEFLASDAMNGRGDFTRDEWIAATYMGSQMRAWGLEPLGDAGGYVQRVDVGRVQATAPPTLSIGNERWTHGQQMLVQSVGKGSVGGTLTPLTAGTSVPAGAFVLVPAASAPSAEVLAPAAAVLMEETPQVRVTWAAAGGRLPGSAGGGRGGNPAQARIVLSTEAFAHAQASAGTKVTFDASVQPVSTWNAVGKLTGGDPARASEVILLTAHLDHLGNRASATTPPGADTIYNGADDDASGSTAVLELAEAIARGPRPKRTMVFAWFGNEESGGAGAKHFLDQPPVPLAQIVANLEFEMIGRADEKVKPHELWLTGYERSNLGPELAKQGALLVADPHPDQNFFQRSDNIQLACQGVIAQTVSSFGLHKDYHQVSDEISTIDFAHMTDAIQSMYAPVMWLANSTFKPDWLPGKKPGPGNGCR
jgi:hypothetical protein